MSSEDLLEEIEKVKQELETLTSNATARLINKLGYLSILKHEDEEKERETEDKYGEDL